MLVGETYIGYSRTPWPQYVPKVLSEVYDLMFHRVLGSQLPHSEI